MNADAPGRDCTPTVRAMDYITLAEYCRVTRLDYDAAYEALADSDVTYGGYRGEMTFISATNLSLVLKTACPETLDPLVAVWLG